MGILDPRFQGFSRSPAFVLILEKCWDLMANISCYEIPDHVTVGVTLHLLCRHLKPSLAVQKKPILLLFQGSVFQGVALQGV